MMFTLRVRRSCGALEDTNSAGLSSALDSKYCLKCRCAWALRYTSRYLLPFPSTMASPVCQRISSLFKAVSSDTLTSLLYKNSTIARSRSLSQAHLTFSSFSCDKDFFMVWQYFIGSSPSTGLQRITLRRCSQRKKLLKTSLMLFRYLPDTLRSSLYLCIYLIRSSSSICCTFSSCRQASG